MNGKYKIGRVTLPNDREAYAAYHEGTVSLNAVGDTPGEAISDLVSTQEFMERHNSETTTSAAPGRVLLAFRRASDGKASA